MEARRFGRSGRALIFAFAALSISCERFCSHVLVYDIGPNTTDGTAASPNDATAGLTLRVDGSADWLYAVTLNAGVYRSVAKEFNGAWVQLPNSPRRAYSLAVDALDVRHVLVGERDGDNGDPSTNHSGVWESLDGGNTWQNYFDPRSLQPSCDSQAVESVAISRTGTLVAATTCGVAICPKGGSWTYAQLPSGFPDGRVTAVAASASKVWARDASYHLVVADSSAQVFTALPAPPPVQAGATDDRSYVLTSSGVVVRTNATSANAAFGWDNELSGLVSGTGTFPFVAGFAGANGANVDVAVHNGGWPTETLSDMAFDYNDPSHIAASSPFTGVFVSLGKGWLNPSSYLPRPTAPVVSVGISGLRVYVGSLGRGVLMLDGIDKAPRIRRWQKLLWR